MEALPQLTLTLHPGGTHWARLLHLENNALPGFIATALVLLTLRDAATEASLLGITWPVTLAPVAYSEGDYEATLADTLVVSVGQRIIATVVVTADGGAKRTFTERVMVTEG